MEHNANKRNSFAQTDLTIPCKTGNISVFRVVLECKDDDGERLDISAGDEDEQTALSLAKQLNNEKLVAMIEQNLFLRAVENDDIKTVKTHLSANKSNTEDLHHLEHYRPTDNHEHNYGQMEKQSREDNVSEKSPRKRLEEEVESPRIILKDSITRSVWLKSVAMAELKCHDEMLKFLFNQDHFIHGFNEDGQTILHQVVAEYLVDYNFNEKLKTLEILLKSGKFSANVVNLQNETIFEIVCKIEPNDNSQIDELLQILFQNGIDLNGRNRNNETFLMLACKNRRVDIVRSLVKMASHGFVLDVDDVDNSGETALMKAKQNDDSDIIAAVLILKLIYAVEDKKEDIVKSILDEFHNTSDIFMKSWNSNNDYSDMRGKRENAFDIWRDAMYLAIEKDTKHSEKIQRLLLDCDFLLSQEMEIGYSIQVMHFGEDHEHRVIEMLLKSGKMNANASDDNGSTGLHLTKDEKLASLLIRHGADVNRKDSQGMTPSMSSNMRKGTILEVAGTSVDLNAIDCNGRTALINAVMRQNTDAVEYFLNAGASVNLSDHLGFTALHHALYGDIWRNLEFPRNSVELRKRKEMSILFDAENHHEDCNWYGRIEWNAERMKIVEMLLQRPDMNVNALSYEKFSPLDIAEGRFPQIPSFIKNVLKEKGALLNVFQQTESQSTSEFYLDVRCKWTVQLLVNWVIRSYKEDLDFHKETLLTLINTFKDQISSCKDQQGRTALHLATAISFYIFPLVNRNYAIDLAIAIVKELISVGCSVNATDIFGRTPLHYANEVLWKVLLSKGADASIKDKDGNCARKETSLLSSSVTSNVVRAIIYPNEETYYIRLMNNKQMEINVDSRFNNTNEVPEFWRKKVKNKNVSNLLWEEGEYACRHPLFKQITEEVIDFMDTIAKEIERLDPRFEIRVEFVGGSNEGTKIDKADEFDFCIVLTKISEICEVSQSPELPTGFVRIRQKSRKVDDESDFDGLFMEDGILNTEKLNRQFTIVLWNALINIEGHQNSKWNLILPIQNISNVEKVSSISMSTHMNSTSINHISIDIVPCIHVDGWWPDVATSTVSEDIKKFGCNLVFDSPRNLYPWVPYSESCARISFAKAESDMIKQSCDNARQAYMIGKTMIEKSDSPSKYTLKNCLLYCIEALAPTSEKATQLGLRFEELESKFHQMNRYLWLKCLMKCHLEFVSQNFLPIYFLPKFSSPIGGKQHKGKLHLKDLSLGWIADRITSDGFDTSFPKLCRNAYALYRCASNDTSESCCQLPAPDPLWERFDRKQLIANLCEIAYK